MPQVCFLWRGFIALVVCRQNDGTTNRCDLVCELFVDLDLILLADIDVEYISEIIHVYQRSVGDTDIEVVRIDKEKQRSGGSEYIVILTEMLASDSLFARRPRDTIENQHDRIEYAANSSTCWIGYLRDIYSTILISAYFIFNL